MKVGFIEIKKYSNVSQKVLSNDYFCYFSKFFDVVKLEQSCDNLEEWFKEVTRNRIEYIFLNDWPNPELFRHRTENRIDVNFIILPYVFIPWIERYKEIMRYVGSKDIVIAHSKFLENAFKSLSDKFTLFRMPIPIDCTLFNIVKSKKKSGLDIVFCGRMLPYKGLDILLIALNKIKDKYFFKLHIISEIENQDYMKKFKNIDFNFYFSIKKLVSDFNLKSRVVFYGSLAENQNKKRDILSHADALVHLSTDEGETFGRVITEAFAAGLAVITTKWQALDELVTDYENGFLINIGKGKEIDVNEVSLAIEKLYDQKILSRMQSANILKAKKYDYRIHLKDLQKKLCQT